MKLSIDKPCGENWDAMNPNEKGAFCLSCQKNVIDFSSKTVKEIKNFFIKLPETESVCGRFAEDQLEEISFDDFFKKFKGWHFFQRVAVITFFVFGFGLYGCAQSSPPEHQRMLKGDVAYEPVDSIKAQRVKDSLKVKSQENKNVTMGELKCISEPKPKPKVMGKSKIIRKEN